MFRLGFFIWRYLSRQTPSEEDMITVMGDDEDDAVLADDGTYLEVYQNG